MVSQTGTYDLFDAIYPEYKSKKPVRLIEFFGGIGSQAKAIERLGVPFEAWRLCEIDKFAVESYNAIHGTQFSTSDIMQTHAEDLDCVAGDLYDYILTYSYPCTSLSLAGKREGMAEGSGTASSLIWEVRRVLKEMSDLYRNKSKNEKGEVYCLPKILLMENVPQVIDAKNVGDLNKMRDFLESLGYSNYLAIMRGDDYGVPQARHRAFMISILGDETNPVYSYQFPVPCGCLWNMRDCLTDDFDTKLYERNSVAHTVCEENAAFNRNVNQKLKEIKLCGRVNAHQSGGVFDPTGVSPTLTAGGTNELRVLYRKPTDLVDSENWKDPYWLGQGAVNVDETVIESNDDAVEFFFMQEKTEKDYSKQPDYQWVPVVRDGVEFTIRNLSPQESLQIMDFDLGDYQKCSTVTSKFQIHQQSGNSIVVNCLVAILGQFFEGRENVYRDIAKIAPKQRVNWKPPVIS